MINICYFIIQTLVVASTAGAAEASAKAMPAELTGVMRRNFDAIIELQPYLADVQKFRDAKSKPEIERMLDSLSDLNHVQSPMVQEPGFAAIAALYGQTLRDARVSFKAGANGDFVRNQLRTMTGYCMSCHTRLGDQRNFLDAAMKVEKSNLSPFEKAQFLAATRQFDKAQTALEDWLLQTPPGEISLIELSRGIRSLLSIVVRVKQDPKGTVRLLERLAKRTDLPEYLRHTLDLWRADAEMWAKEEKYGTSHSGAQRFGKAQELVLAAAKKQQYPADPSADLNYLRATSLIHEALQLEPKGKFRGEALYALGAAYEALQDPLLWGLGSMYFEACVREFPHTALARKSVKRFTDGVVFGYSGSGGTYVPEDERARMDELRRLAQ